MRLYIEELKKMLRCRSSWLVMIAILALQVISAISGYQDLQYKCGNVAEYNTYAEQYNGTLILDMVESDDIHKMQMNVYQRPDNTKEAYFYEQYLAAISRAIEYKTQYGDDDAPKYWNSVGINYLVQNLTTSVSTIFVFIGLLFGLHPIFMKDVENGMDKIIYSTYHGRKQILRAKCIAGIIFEIVWVTIYYFSLILFNVTLFGNIGALVVPINYIPCLYLCSWGINVWQYFLIGYLLLLITSTFMTACIMLIYAKVKKIMVGLGAGLALIFLPMFIPKNGNWGKVFCILPSVFSNTSLIVGENLSLRFLGMEVPIVGLGCMILPLGTVFIFLLLKRIFWNGRVEL